MDVVRLSCLFHVLACIVDKRRSASATGVPCDSGFIVVAARVTARILGVEGSQFLMAGPVSKAELSRNLGQQRISGQLNKAVRLLVAKERIVYTLPEMPQSRLQEYRLTAEGGAAVASLGAERHEDHRPSRNPLATTGRRFLHLCVDQYRNYLVPGRKRIDRKEF